MPGERVRATVGSWRDRCVVAGPRRWLHWRRSSACPARQCPTPITGPISYPPNCANGFWTRHGGWATRGRIRWPGHCAPARPGRWACYSPRSCPTLFRTPLRSGSLRDWPSPAGMPAGVCCWCRQARTLTTASRLPPCIALQWTASSCTRYLMTTPAWPRCCSGRSPSWCATSPTSRVSITSGSTIGRRCEASVPT